MWGLSRCLAFYFLTLLLASWQEEPLAGNSHYREV